MMCHCRRDLRLHPNRPERLAKGGDVIVHSTIHPIMGPDKGSGFFPHAYFRQSNAFDLEWPNVRAQNISCLRT